MNGYPIGVAELVLVGSLRSDTGSLKVVFSFFSEEGERDLALILDSNA